ncbi:MDR family MFS transporter [Staphylospora marina]|uniref:MDR family MFS transporter n=1 Tax=Staphylospora marina TaxID=2490858 RepID=UPI000F5BFA6E|nr:MFS transporter [Staphylospora marina]
MNFFGLHRNIRIRLVSLFLTRTANNTVFPFVGIYFVDKLGTDKGSLALFLISLVTMLAGFPGGYLADRIGRKKMILISESFMFLAFAGMTLANSPLLDSVRLTWWMMILHGAGLGLSLPATDAMIIDSSNSENRRTVYTLQYWIYNLSIMIGSLIGGLYFLDKRFWLFLALSVVSLINLLLFATLRELMPAPTKAPDLSEFLSDFSASYRKVAVDRLFILYWIASLAVLSLEFQFPYYVTVLLHRTFPEQTLSISGLFSATLDGIQAVSWLRMENTVLIVAGALLLSSWIKKMNDRAALTGGIALYTVGNAALVLTQDIGLLLLAVFVYTLGEVIFIPVKQSMLADLADERSRSAYMAVYNQLFHVGRLAGSLGISLGARLTPGWMAFLFLITGFAGLMLFRTICRRMEHRLSSPPHGEKKMVGQP